MLSTLCPPRPDRELHHHRPVDGLFTKSGYVITVTPGAAAAGVSPPANGVAAGDVVWTYYVVADPIPNGGSCFFGMNQGGTIYTLAA